MVIQVPCASAPTPNARIISGITIVTSIPGIIVVPVEFSSASVSRCLVLRVDSGTIREWLIL